MNVRISSKNTIKETTGDSVVEGNDKHICAIPQNITHATNLGRDKMPKHVALAMFMRHLTRSKQLSYSLWAFFVIRNRNNITPRLFTKNANWRIAVDMTSMTKRLTAVKGTTHATSMVFFQRKQCGSKPQHQVYADHSLKKQSLSGHLGVWSVLKFSPHVIYRGKIEQEWYIEQACGIGTPAREVIQI